MMYKDEMILVSIAAGRDKDGFPKAKADVRLTEVFAEHRL